MTAVNLMIIEGRIGPSGLGINKKGEVAHFAAHSPEFVGAYPGTINLNMNSTIDPQKLKIEFDIPMPVGDPKEFIRVCFEYPIGQMTRGWIYQPFGYHWGKLGKRNFLEVMLSAEIERPVIDKPCRVHLINGGNGHYSKIADKSAAEFRG